MARESAIDQLAPEHKNQLDDKLFDNGFNGYQDLAGWLQRLGYEISKSSVHRYGKKLEGKLAAAKVATDMAIHFADNAADDTGALSNATITLMQTELFNTLVALKELEDGQPTEERLLLLAKISKPFSELARASVTQKKFEGEVKERARAELLAEQAEKLEEHAQAGGLGAEQVDFWRREFLGVRSEVKKVTDKLKAFTDKAVNAGAKLFATLKPARDTKAIVEWEELPQSVRDIPDTFNPMADGLLMKHQSETIALSHEYDILVVEKGRRTGITFGMALDKSLVAASQRYAGGDNVYYVGDTKEKGLEFVGYCAKFLRTIAVAQGQGVSGIEEFLFEDQDEHGKTKYITSWRIRLASGFQIVALSSRPENIRGLQGHVVIDEAAFHRNVQAVLDAATALLIWGSRIVIISTHNGTTNAFNQLIKEVEGDVYKDTAVVYKVTFDDAVANGLYERVCLIKGELPTSEGKEKWYKKIRRGYGSRKAQMREELDAIPRDGNSTSLPTVWIERASVQNRPVLRLILPENFVEKTVDERQDFANAWINTHLKPLLVQLNPRMPWYFGQDYARHRDFSIINPLGIEQNLQRNVPFVIEMQKVPATQQMQILWAFIDGLPNFVGGAMDATGSGETTAELTADKFGHDRIMQVKITQSWYGEYMPKMTGLFEDDMITIPADQNLTQDLRQIEEVNGIKMINALRRKDLKDPDLVRHGDFAPSLCLSNCAYLNMKNGKLTVSSRPAPKDKDVQQGVGMRQRFNSIIRGY